MRDTDFNINDFDEYDVKCRQCGKVLLATIYKEKTIKDNSDKYGPDLVVGKSIYYEVEYKTFQNIEFIEKKGLHISQRKLKYYSDDKVTVHHITFLDNFNKAILFRNNDLRQSKCIVKNCKRGSTNYEQAKFIEMSMDKAIRLQLVNNKWIKVNKFITNI
jgi:hypothetical protein